MPVPASDIKFSILILSIPERIESMKAAVNHLQEQADATGQPKSVEILVMLDNRSKSISEKRNDLLMAARGKYIAFLDDDDAVSKDYMSKILQAIDEHNGVDCISFNQWCSLDGEPMDVEFGIGNPHGQLWRDEDGFLGDIKRPPYHMCLWRRDIAITEGFNPVYGANGQSSEDIDWLMRLYPKIQTEHHIDDALHGYIYNSKTTTSLVPQDQQ
jgi:glycosyltransferase involved in cell wall biosynthesis